MKCKSVARGIPGLYSRPRPPIPLKGAVGMKRRTKKWLLALAGATAGAAGAIMIRGRAKMSRRNEIRREPRNVWARPGMPVVFRAELMPGLNRPERTFRVAEVLPSGRVLLDAIAGEHAENEFEPLRRS